MSTAFATSWAPRLRPALRGVGWATLGGLLAWSLGFAWFFAETSRAVPPPPPADGIVALTGGAERIETALRLLAQERARLLLVSGTGGGAELSGLAHRAGLDPLPLSTRVTLGRQATTTRGNAAETAAWASANGIRSLIVVTSGYHMPRAMTELARAMPDVRLLPAPVTPPAMQGGAGWRDPGMLRLTAEEYSKWLLAWAGLSALGPDHAPASASVAPQHELRTSQIAPARKDDDRG